jgi:hypothetical protein
MGWMQAFLKLIQTNLNFSTLAKSYTSNHFFFLVIIGCINFATNPVQPV